MTKPFAGVTMAFRCVAVNLGKSNPLLVEETSNAAEVSGAVVPIPTLPSKVVVPVPV